eukprot:5427594-Prymnesium_polylepis.1
MEWRNNKGRRRITLSMIFWPAASNACQSYRFTRGRGSWPLADNCGRTEPIQHEACMTDL